MKKKKIKLDYFIILIVLIIGLTLGSLFDIDKTIYTVTSPSQEFSSSTISLIAVNNQGEGIAIPLKVEAKIGNGKVLTNIDKLLFWADTQYSIQTAKDVAENITGIDANNFDLMYNIDANETGIVGGPSAGAALTIATIGALENKSFADDIMITGTIEPDGTIGKVGGILEKAKGAKNAGAKIFLVPRGQGTEIKLSPTTKCMKTGYLEYCEISYQKETIAIGQETGIAIIEVKNIQDAVKYFY